MTDKNPIHRATTERLLERHVEHAGDQLMASLGFTAVRLSQTRASRQTPGIPDRKYYHLARGLTLWWEAKRPGGRQSTPQRVFQAMVESCGEYYALGGIDALKSKLWCLVRDRGIQWKSVESFYPTSHTSNNP